MYMELHPLSSLLIQVNINLDEYYTGQNINERLTCIK